ncbi:DUF5713 family protein [Vibrio metschnikovii]|uniref:DUF5713 family protein n=1 Tax=Vibrio metschnikovii TaxID=28172 RepID=UPI002FC853D0
MGLVILRYVETKENIEMSIKNPDMASYQFLQEMYKDGYFPNFLVDKGKDILVRLCEIPL